jgi:uncharacterized protein (DUF305 family)
MKSVIAIGFVLIAALTACKRAETTTDTGTVAPAATETTSTTAAGQTTTAASSAPYDLQFIDSLMRHHQMAIEMAKMAEPKFEHKDLKDAAKKMIADQTEENQQLRAWRDQWYPGAAPAENMQMPGMSSMNMDMSHMQSMSGHALDMMFIDMMIPHHEGGLAMGKDALAKAEHQEIKDLAQKMTEMQAKEIDQMRAWKQAWAK